MSIKEKAPTAAKHNESPSIESEADTNSTNENGKDNLFEWVSRFELTQVEVGELSDPTWLVPNVVISSHLILIAAEPNAGKTTIFSHLAGELSKIGQQVLYVNADIGGADVKKAHNQAKKHGYTLLLPDFKVGESIQSIGIEIEKLANAEERLTGTVLIIDTLKKIADVQNKAHIKEVMKVFRRLTARGMTVILLAHTNKYKDEEGNPIFEGTGDLRADVDELIYLIPHRNDDGSMYVTTKPDKVRGSFEEITFNISSTQEVSLSKDSQVIQEQIRVQQEVEADANVIECIKGILAKRDANQKQLVDDCRNAGIPIRRAKDVIQKYADTESELPVLWIKSKGSGKTIIYSLKP